MKGDFFVTRTGGGVKKTMTQGGAWNRRPGDRRLIYSGFNCRQTIVKALIDNDRADGVNVKAYTYEAHDHIPANA